MNDLKVTVSGFGAKQVATSFVVAAPRTQYVPPTRCLIRSSGFSGMMISVSH